MVVAEKEKQEVEVKIKKEKSRDYAIDLMRLFSCFTVILMHLSLHVYNVYDVQVDWSRLFEKSFFTEGVPLFFMITGFFIVNGRTYKKILKNTFFKILVPVAFYVIFSQVFYKFLVNKESFLYCLKELNFNWPGIIEAILKGNVSSLQGICDHLWYIVSYVKITIWIPVLWLVCKDEPISNLARRMMIVMQFIHMLLIDIQRFYVLPMGEISSYTIIDFELIYVLLGYEMFLNRDFIKNNKKWVRIIFVITFIGLNLLRYNLEKQLMIINHYTDILGRDTFVEWRYTSLNVITGIFTFAFIYSFDVTNEKFKKVLAWLSDKTFGIYLLHYLILAKVDLFHFEPLGKFWQEILYLGIGLIVVFWGSILMVIICRFIKNMFLKLCEKIIKIISKKEKTQI